MNRSMRSMIALGASLAVTGLVIVTPASADDGLTGTDILQAIQDASPDVLANIAAVPTSETAPESIDSTIGSVAVSVPEDPAGQISLDPTAGPTLAVGLPFSATSDDSTVVKKGIVAYDNNNGSTTVPVVKSDGSVQINTVIDSAAAPSRYSYPLTLPPGGSAEVTDDGTVAIDDASGNWVGGFSPAWAKDADGKAVPTHFEVAGSTLTQVVDHVVSPELSGRIC